MGHIGISRRSSAVRAQFETSFNFFEILWRRVGRQEPPWLSRKVRPVGLPVLCLAASAGRGGPHGSSTTDSRKPRGSGVDSLWPLLGQPVVLFRHCTGKRLRCEVLS